MPYPGWITQDQLTGELDSIYVAKNRQDLYLGDYVNADGTDEISGFAQAMTDAQTLGRRVIGIPGKTVKVSEIVNLWSGCRIDGKGMTLDIQTDHTATGRYIGGTGLADVKIKDLKVNCSNATARNQDYGVVSFFGGSYITLEDLTILGGEGVGIFTGAASVTDAAGVQYLWIIRPRISGTKADGIHISRGAAHVWVTNPVISNTGDDAITFIGIQTDDGTHNHNPITDVHVENPNVSSFSTSLGTGVKFHGVQGATLLGGRCVGAKANGLHIGADSGGNGTTTFASSDIDVSGYQIRSSVGHGMIVSGTNVNISGGSSRQNSGSGLEFITATNCKAFSVDISGNTGFGIYETGASSGCHVVTCDLRSNGNGPDHYDDTASCSSLNCITA